MKNYWPVIVVSLLVLGGCGTATTLTNTVPTTAKTQAGSVATSLKDLLAGGKDQKCTWTLNENGSSMSGTLLISGKKFKQEIIITDPETKAENQMFSLSDGESLYTWGTAMGTQGFKTSIAETQNVATDSSATTPAQGKVDLSKQYQYQCEPWTVSETDLTVPTNITFTDMANQLKQLKDLQKKAGY
jgi:uncharacterized protein YceK